MHISSLFRQTKTSCFKSYCFDSVNMQVASFPIDDNNCPPLQLVSSFCESAYTWLKAGLENVVVVHCKAGMARTGLMISCLLLFLKVYTQTSPLFAQCKWKLKIKSWSPESAIVCPSNSSGIVGVLLDKHLGEYRLGDIHLQQVLYVESWWMGEGVVQSYIGNNEVSTNGSLPLDNAWHSCM